MYVQAVDDRVFEMDPSAEERGGREIDLQQGEGGERHGLLGVRLSYAQSFDADPPGEQAEVDVLDLDLTGDDPSSGRLDPELDGDG